MSDRKPRIEEVVASLTARLAAAHEIRAHAAWLMKVADAQQDAARAEAGQSLGDHGERLYHVVAGAYDHGSELGSRIDEVPGLAESLLAPWEAGRARDVARPQAEVPSAAPPPPAPQLPAPLPAAPIPTVPSVPDRRDDPVPAPPRAAPVVDQTGDAVMYGLAVPRSNATAAGKIVRQAKDLVATGDASHYESHGSKWVGVHQWRRDLFRAAFATEARAAGLALPEDPATGVQPSPESSSPMGEAVHLASMAMAEPDEAESPQEDEGYVDADQGLDFADEPDGEDAEAEHVRGVGRDDVVFGADEEQAPLPVAAAAYGFSSDQPDPDFLVALEGGRDQGGLTWPPARDGPAMPRTLPAPGAKVAPGLFKPS